MAIYYVSPTGDDGEDGVTPETAWLSISKVNASSFSAGDSILFEKNGVWRESLLIPSSGSGGSLITFGAYGSGNNPIVTGADLIEPGANWSLMDGNVTVASQTGKTGSTNLNIRNVSSNSEQANTWVATETFSVTSVTCWGRKNGTPTGNVFLKIYSESGGVPNTSIGQSDNVDVSSLTTDAGGAAVVFTFSTPVALAEGSTYYFSIAGDFSISTSNYAKFHGAVPDATWVTRFAYTPWTVKTDFVLYMIVQKANDVIWQTSGITTNPVVVLADNIFCKKVADLSSLAAEYEFYWASNVLYLYSPADPDTRYSSVEHSVRDQSINTNTKSYVKINDISARISQISGIRITGNCSFITVDSCNCSDNGEFGILCPSAVTQSNISITNNVTDYNGSTGIKCTGTLDYLTITSNSCTRNGAILGADELLWGAGVGFYGYNKTHVLISGNTVSYSGYDKDNNRISPSNINKGVGIWMDTVMGSVEIKGNTTFNNAGYGIFIEKSDGILVDYNVSHTNTYDGIRIDSDQNSDSGTHISQNNLIYNNTAYGNTLNGLTCAGGWAQDGIYVKDNVFKNNISVENGVNFCAKWGGDNNGTHGSGNVYINNCFGPEINSFIRWGGQDAGPTYKDTYDDFETAYGGGTNSVEADPLLISSLDFHLQAGSPCKDAGVDVGLVSDFDGTFIDGLPDMGAFEIPRKRQGQPLGLGIGIRRDRE